MPTAIGNSIVGKLLAAQMVSFSVWAGGFFIGMAALLFVRDLAMRPRRHLMDVAVLDRVEPALPHRPNPLLSHQWPNPLLSQQWPNPPLSSESPPDRYREYGRPAPVARPTCWSKNLLRTLDWKRFEELTAALFRELGFRAEILSSGADGGVDVRLYQPESDALSALVQCKSWSTRDVGVKAVRELLGAMTHEKVAEGIFCATGEFTVEAIRLAGENRIELVAGKRFLEMIDALSDDAQQRLLQVATEGDYQTPSCPSCGIKLVRRSGERSEFWGCSNFPRCRYKFNRVMGT